MKNRRKCIVNVIFYVLVWLSYFSMSWFIDSRGDDFVFKAGIERYGTFMGWVKFFSHNWGGRVIPQGVLVCLLQVPEIWFHIFNASAWLLLIVYIGRVFDFAGVWNRKVEILLLSFSVFIVIPYGVLNGAVFWKCANVLYLWGTAGTLVVLYPFVCNINGKHYKKFDIILALIACVYTSSFEQAAVFMSAAAMVLFISDLLKNKKINGSLFTLTVLACILTIIFYKFPGNMVRTEAEVLGQFSKFDMFSIADKILLGIRYAVQNSESEVGILYVAMAFIVVVAVNKFRGEDKFFKVASYVILGYFLLCWNVWTSRSITGSDRNILAQIYLCINVDTVSFSFTFLEAMWECIHIVMLAFLGGMLMLINPGRMNPLVFISYCGGLSTMVIMGFSPTIYASGQRPRFIGYLMLICTVFCTVCELNQKADDVHLISQSESGKEGE